MAGIWFQSSGEWLGVGPEERRSEGCGVKVSIEASFDRGGYYHMFI